MEKKQRKSIFLMLALATAVVCLAMAAIPLTASDTTDNMNARDVTDDINETDTTDVTEVTDILDSRNPNFVLTVNDVDLDYEAIDGVIVVKPTQEQTFAILKAPGSDVVVDIRDSGFNAMNLYVPAGWFKDCDKKITFINDNGEYSVKTKSLWNNSGKTRLITVIDNVGNFKNV